MKKLQKSRIFIPVLLLIVVFGMAGTVFAETIDSYYVWVGGVRLTEKNAKDVFGDGTVSYEPETGVLTLNKANIRQTWQENDQLESGICFKSSKKDDVTYVIRLIGENTVDISDSESLRNFGVAAINSNLRITGEGMLTIKSGQSPKKGLTTGITVDGLLSVDGAEVEIKAGDAEKGGSSYGIFSWNAPGTISLGNGASLTVWAGNAEKSYGIRGNSGKIELKMTAASTLLARGHTQAACVDYEDTFGLNIWGSDDFDGEAEPADSIAKQRYIKIASDHTHEGGTATCGEKAVCEICKARYGKLDPENHTGITDKDGQEPTCTEVGFTAGKYCEGCKTWVQGHEEIPKIPHDFKENNGFCKVCGGYEPAKFNESKKIYEISNAGQLCWFSRQMRRDYEKFSKADVCLTKDIILNENVLADGQPDANSGLHEWMPIGTAKARYRGTFDGANHTISGLYYNGETRYAGLFGAVGWGGTVKNLHVADSWIAVKNPSGEVGGICGANRGGTIRNCSFDGSIRLVCSTGPFFAGGICGVNEGTLENCCNLGTIGGEYTGKNGIGYFGGIAGSSFREVKNCYHAGTFQIDPGDGCAGGAIVGICHENSGKNFYLAEGIKTPGPGIPLNLSQFQSGEGCYKMNRGKTDGTQIWYQKCGTGMPEFGMDPAIYTVYLRKSCDGKTDVYRNVNEDTGHELVYTAEGDVITQSCGVCHQKFATAELKMRNDDPVLFTGHPVEPCRVVCSEGWIGEKPRIVYENNTEVGSRTAKATAGGGDQTVSLIFSIQRTAPDVTAPVALNLTYNGRQQILISAGNSPHGTIQYRLGREGEFSADVPEAKDAGEYTVYYRILGDRNHTDSDVGQVNIKIEPKPVTLKIDSKTKTYGEEDPEFSWSVPEDGILDELAQIRIVREPGQAVKEGGYALTAKQAPGANPNYEITVEPGTLTIEKAVLTVTPGENQRKSLGEEDPEFTYDVSGLTNGDTKKILKGTLERAEGESIGRYDFTAGSLTDSSGNYELKLADSWDDPKFVIEHRPPEIHLPDNPQGYTITTETGETIPYGTDFFFTYALKDGYTETDAFGVYVNGKKATLYSGRYVGYYVTDDVTVTVEGVADITAPSVEIDISGKKWNHLPEDVNFGLYSNRSQIVTLSAWDTGSGIDEISYCLSGEKMTESQLKDWTDWKKYSDAFEIRPDQRVIVYVRATDTAGNVSFASSDGMVLDSTKPRISGISGICYGDGRFTISDENLDFVTVDGEKITGDNGVYMIGADNLHHTILCGDLAGNRTECSVTVYKNYVVEFYDRDTKAGEHIVGFGQMAPVLSEPESAPAGYTFGGWWSGDTRLKEHTKIQKDWKFSAKWIPNTYTVSFMANGGAGTMENAVLSYDEPGKLPKNRFTRNCCRLKGWSMTQNGEPVFFDEDTVLNLTRQPHGSVVLYAVWSQDFSTLEGSNVFWILLELVCAGVLTAGLFYYRKKHRGEQI